MGWLIGSVDTGRHLPEIRPPNPENGVIKEKVAQPGAQTKFETLSGIIPFGPALFEHPKIP
ncbi:MAG: hypothetical protein N4A61_01890 [Pelagimonas sp.]|nr:hypothetical protein [Pelagimonas sp.]